MRILARLLSRTSLALALVLCAGTVPAAAGHAVADPDPQSQGDWRWPVDGPRTILSPYRAPANDYGAGHRGVDIAVPSAGEVRAPADGIVAFNGTVVDRPLITIGHAGGYVTTFEPLSSDLSPGVQVLAGDVVGTLAAGGHTDAGALHIGVRLDGEYINPLLMFDDVPRAVLLPCCGPL